METKLSKQKITINYKFKKSQILQTKRLYN